MKLKPFQLEDLSRFALHNGGVLGWDTGLGKTHASFLLPLLWLGHKSVRHSSQSEGGSTEMLPNGRVLMVIPGDLHAKTIKAATAKFRVKPVLLDCQKTFEDLGPALAPGFYLTSYTQLCSNGVRKMPDPDKWDPWTLMAELALPIDSPSPGGEGKPSTPTLSSFYSERAVRWRQQYNLLNVDPDTATLNSLEAEYRALFNRYNTWPDQKAASNARGKLQSAYEILKNLCPQSLNPNLNLNLHLLSRDQQTWLARELCRSWIDHCSAGSGTMKQFSILNSQFSIKCVYSPSLADLCFDHFDCIIVDEGVKMKGADTAIGRGIRQMDSKYRLVLTATPIKNRLPDLFWLAWWAAGGQEEATARWPFANKVEDQTTFAETFLVCERNLTKEKNSEKKRRFEKLTAEVCNIHKLWKLLGPILLRRRKQECGEDIVPMHSHVVRVPMGKHQAHVYEYHLKADYRDKNGLPAMGAKLQALRVVAADPTSTLLDPVVGLKPNPIALGHRSAYGYTPKLSAALSLVADILERKEQVVIFDAFHDPLDRLSSRLREAGVRHELLDGRTTQKKRGVVSCRFMSGTSRLADHLPIPILLAGVECMSEGHDFYLCPNVILHGYSWALDKFIQGISRVWRMNSPNPVNLWALVYQGSIEIKLESLRKEKSDSAELVLDGKLMGDRTEEVTMAELMHFAECAFAEDDKTTIDEGPLTAEWPRLKARLEAAMATWDGAPIPAPASRSAAILAAAQPPKPAIIRVPPSPPSDPFDLFEPL